MVANMMCFFFKIAHLVSLYWWTNILEEPITSWIKNLLQVQRALIQSLALIQGQQVQELIKKVEKIEEKSQLPLPDDLQEQEEANPGFLKSMITVKVRFFQR